MYLNFPKKKSMYFNKNISFWFYTSSLVSLILNEILPNKIRREIFQNKNKNRRGTVLC